MIRISKDSKKKSEELLVPKIAQCNCSSKNQEWVFMKYSKACVRMPSGKTKPWFQIICRVGSQLWKRIKNIEANISKCQQTLYVGAGDRPDF